LSTGAKSALFTEAKVSKTELQDLLKICKLLGSISLGSRSWRRWNELRAVGNY